MTGSASSHGIYMSCVCKSHANQCDDLLREVTFVHICMCIYMYML